MSSSMYRCHYWLLCFMMSAFSFGAWSQSGPATFPLTTQAAKTLIDSLNSQLIRFYINKEAAVKIARYLSDRQKKGIYESVGDAQELGAMLTRDVYAVHKDEHFHVEYNPALVSELAGEIEDVPKLVADRLRQDQRRNFGFTRAEILPGNTGYLEISGFSRLNVFSRTAANNVLHFFDNVDAMIIDIRYGMGGSPEMLTFIAGHFFDKKTHISDIYIRSENATLPYFTSPDSTFKRLHGIPLYILTSYKTFSAAEGFAYALQRLHRATVVGEVTRGGAHTVTYRPLSSGFVADIPFGNVLDPVSKTNWEGKGIQPDIKVSSDRALETAELMILDKSTQNSTDTATRRYLRWQRLMVYSKTRPMTIDSTTSLKYIGAYGPFIVSFENGTLYYQKAGKAKFPMIMVNDHQMCPRGTDNFVVEFLNNDAGKITWLLTRYDDGREERGEIMR